MGLRAELATFRRGGPLSTYRWGQSTLDRLLLSFSHEPMCCARRSVLRAAHHAAQTRDGEQLAVRVRRSARNGKSPTVTERKDAQAKAEQRAGNRNRGRGKCQ